MSGCVAVQDIGNTLKYNIQGEYYLKENEYQKGRQTFSQAVQVDKNNPEAHYYYGRFLLANKSTKKALRSFKEAVKLHPQKSEYHFWLGVAYGEQGQVKQERKSYEKAIQLDPQNIQALTYLGNNLLRAKKYKQALAFYEKTLELWEYSPQALYNRAVILRKLQRIPEEKLALLDYLYSYPSGSFARRAADRLNVLGDNSYRNYVLGARTVTLTEIYFVPFSAELADGAFASLDLVGATVSNMPTGKLNVIVHQLNNKELAKKRTQSIRNYLYSRFPELQKKKRIQISWFDVPETRKVLNKRLRLNQSVQFFLTNFKISKK